MYNAKIITDTGNTVRFGYEYGTVFDISPLSGVSQNLKTSQGFQQIGVTVDNIMVGGVTRKISGNIVGDKRQIANEIINLLPLFTRGRLYFNDDYFCNIVVSKTPEVKLPESGIPKFMLQVLCTEPYWMRSEMSNYISGVFTPAFSFPVLYDSHEFGTRSVDPFFNVYNGGNVRAPLSVKFRTYAYVENYGFMDVNTLEFVKINGPLDVGEEVDMYWDNGKLLLKKTFGGVVTDIFSQLDEESSLFWAKPGDNVVRMTADDTGDQNLIVSVSFYEAVTGVV